MEQEKTFLGTGWSFPPAFERTVGVVMVSDEDDIQQSLTILLSTDPGERIMNPSYGCPIRALVFEGVTANFEAQLKYAIKQAILYFEPRITLDDIIIDKQRMIDGVLDLHLYYTVIITNTRHNMVYPFYIQEGTNITPRG
jgi:phage baseplate assembly protein W